MVTRVWPEPDGIWARLSSHADGAGGAEGGHTQTDAWRDVQEKAEEMEDPS